MDAMQLSGHEDYVDVSVTLQNKLYYEEETLNVVLGAITSYTSQSHAYLDAVVHLAYVLLRLLEKFSKSNAHMFIKKKARVAARRKKSKFVFADWGSGVGADAA